MVNGEVKRRPSVTHTSQLTISPCTATCRWASDAGAAPRAGARGRRDAVPRARDDASGFRRGRRARGRRRRTSGPPSASIRTRRRTSIPRATERRSRSSRGGRGSPRSARSVSTSITTTLRGRSRSRSSSGCSISPAALGKPAILHNRESGPEMLALLERLPRRERPGVFHSFTENAEYGRRAIGLGYVVSFSGMITFRAAENIREAARGAPARRDAGRDGHAVSRTRAAPGQTLRAGLRRRDGEEAGGGQGRRSRDGGRATTGNFERLFVKEISWGGARPRPSIRMSSHRIGPAQFEAYVEEALASVPRNFRKYLENVVVARRGRAVRGGLRGDRDPRRGGALRHLPRRAVLRARGPTARAARADRDFPGTDPALVREPRRGRPRDPRHRRP